MRALEQALLANTLADWLSALGIALGLFAAFWILKRSVIRRLAAYARTTPNPVDDVVAATIAATRLLLALFRRLREHDIEFANPTRALHVSHITPDLAGNTGGNP